jgi:hypothetical protein
MFEKRKSFWNGFHGKSRLPLFFSGKQASNNPFLKGIIGYSFLLGRVIP